MSRPSKSSQEPLSAPSFFSTQVSEARRFFRNLHPPKKTPLAVVSGGLERCLPQYHIQRKTFPFYTIEYVLRGQGSLKIHNRSHALSPGAVFSYGPGVPHEITADSAAPPVKYFVDFSGVQAKTLLQSCQLPVGTITRMAMPGELQSLFDELIRCGQRGGPNGNELCAKLLECIALGIADSRVSPATVETLALLSYQKSRRHIEEHFLRLRSLAQIAEECNLDPAYLCRLFQRYDHQTPYQFLTRLKMNAAADWLSAPGAMVKQVAERAGFRDQFHFSRAFKKVFGVAPAAFRRLR